MMNCSYLVLWLTGECNLCCRYCYAAGRSSVKMEMTTAEKALQQAGNRPFCLQFAGGEPLMNLPLLEEILEYVRRRRLPARCSIQTNATLLTDRTARLLKRNRVAVGVSLDGKPGINEKLRGKTREAVEGVRLLG